MAELPSLIMNTKQPYYASNKFLMVKQIDILKKAVHEILNNSDSNKDDKIGRNRDKSSDDKAKGQNRSEDDSNSETET
jgi:hypothetical protein